MTDKIQIALPALSLAKVRRCLVPEIDGAIFSPIWKEAESYDDVQ